MKLLKRLARLLNRADIFLSIALCISASAISYAEVIDRIAVQVNDEVITQREIDRILAPINEQYRGLYFGDQLINKVEEARKKVLEQLIDDKIILSEAKRLNVPIEDREVDERLQETEKHFPSLEAFEKALAEQSMSIRDLKKRYKEQMMVRRLVDQRVGSKVSVSPVEIAKYYEKHANDFVRPEQIKLSNILIRPKINIDLKQALEQAKDIEVRLKEGGDFGGLAREYSEGPNAGEGGTMGFVKKGDLLPEIEAVVFNLNEGETSNIIQTTLGYHIFKVDQKMERKAMELSEIRREVEEAIYRDKIKDKIKDWIIGLKKNAYIAYK